MKENISNSDFDVNILENAFSEPAIELTFPLPADDESALEFKPSEKVSSSFRILGNFVKFATGINFNDIYSNAETKYSINKMSRNFNITTEKYMLHKLKEGDPVLDDIVYKLVDSELKMNLIKAKEFPKRFKDVKEFMVRYYTMENRKNLPNFGSVLFLRVCYVTVMKTISKMFPRGVWVNKSELHRLYQKYLKKPMSIMLLPNHQSHIDYVILHLILIRFQMSIPVVVAGENLNVAIFGGILKGLGAIFIKRSFNEEFYTERNLYNYIEFVLLNKIHFEVFIEGTRSRDGKLLLPKYGILKALLSIYLKHTFGKSENDFDVLIQPISIIYEKVYESDGYLDELIGKDKKQESFLNIMSNGVSNLLNGVDRGDSKHFILGDGFINNKNKALHGKIFVKLAENFTLSSFVGDKANLVELGADSSLNEGRVNLKKLGFQVMHAINKVSFLPQNSIVGTSIQTYYYLYGKRSFGINELIPMFDLITRIYLEEDLSETNSKMLSEISDLSKAEKAELIKSQIIGFFKFTMVNPKTDRIVIENSFELLYYKNRGMHLIIHKCLAAFILSKTLKLEKIEKLFYIFTGFLKNEFLFDYNYDRCGSISFILHKFKTLGVISDNLAVIDHEYHQTLCAIIQPFIKSFMVCVDSLNSTVGKYFSRANKNITEQQLINDSLMQNDYPTTKNLLRIIQEEGMEKSDERNGRLYHVETYNKQYLLSFLFYLNNLKLIKIFKNKSRTKAYVLIKSPRDLDLLQAFLQALALGNDVDDLTLDYVIDIVDKSWERNIEVVKAKL